MKIKLTERQYKNLLKEFTEVMVMCTPWKRCMDDPYGENKETKWFVGRLDYNENVGDWFPYSQDSMLYKSREEASQAYYDGRYGKEPLMEMRHDGKHTGLFKGEETEKVNEFFGKKVGNYIRDKKQKAGESFKKFIEATRREGKETAVAANILLKLIKNRDEVSQNDIDFLKAQSKDLAKIVAVVGMGAVSSVIPIAVEKILNKYDISIMPSSQNLGREDIDTNEDLSEGKKKKNKLCARGVSAAKSKYDVYPSAYANGYAVQVCKGKIAGLDGNKRCSGSYCKGKRNESHDLDGVEVVERIDEDLAVWFGTKKKGKSNKQPQGPWVNICRNKEGGGHPECGRGDSDKGGYPVCRARSVAARMSQSAKDSACRRKREREKTDGKSGKGQTPSPIKIKNYKSKKNESININRMLITENRTIISEGLKYHLDNQIPLRETVYRYGSESFFNLINEVRDLHQKGKIDLSYDDQEIIKTDIGKQGIYEGKKVWLDIPNEYIEINEAEYRGKKVELSKPKRGGSKKFYVYVMCNGNVRKISFGAKSGGGNLAVKLRDPKARKAFADRHNCSQKNDKCSAGYWSCRLPRYAKQLGLSGGGTWW